MKTYSKIIVTNNISKEPIIFVRNTIPYTGGLSDTYNGDNVYVMQEYHNHSFDAIRASMSIFLHNGLLYRDMTKDRHGYYFDEKSRLNYTSIQFIE